MKTRHDGLRAGLGLEREVVGALLRIVRLDAAMIIFVYLVGRSRTLRVAATTSTALAYAAIASWTGLFAPAALASWVAFHVGAVTLAGALLGAVGGILAPFAVLMLIVLVEIAGALAWPVELYAAAGEPHGLAGPALTGCLMLVAGWAVIWKSPRPWMRQGPFVTSRSETDGVVAGSLSADALRRGGR